MSIPETFDVVIVGAGIVGTALACGLADSALRIAIIEQRQPDSDWPQHSQDVSGFGSRVSALTHASQQWLEELSVWPAIAGQRVCAYRQMQVWDADGTGSIAFCADEIQQPQLGHIVENRLINIALTRRLQQHQQAGRISGFVPDKIASIRQHNNSHTLLQLDSGVSIETALLVAADGALSPLRERCGFAMREWDYGHHAIVATVKTALSHQHTAWQRFMSEGPLAFLPLGGEDDRHCSIVWSVLPELAEQLIALSDQDFAEALTKAFEYRLGAVEAVGERACFPLRQRHAINYSQSGVVLVGDAAHTIHPLAGQGLNLGLMDARVLAEELLRARRRELGAGDRAILQRYQRRRKAANLTMMAGMEGFKRLFETPELPLRWLRNAGMSWVSGQGVLKQQLMRQAMGL